MSALTHRRSDHRAHKPIAGKHTDCWHLWLAAVIAATCLVLTGTAHATDWGFANAGMCDHWGKYGAWPGGTYLGDCGSYSNGYSQDATFEALTQNRDVATGGQTPIGQHSANERFFLAWDAAGTDTWKKGLGSGCVQATRFQPAAQAQDMPSLIDAAIRARQNGENVVISLVPDVHGYDGLSYSPSSPSYPPEAHWGMSIPPTPVDLFCGAYEALALLRSWGQAAGVTMDGHVALEAFNEPDNVGVSPSVAASDFCWVEGAAAEFGDWTLAGVFRSGGAYDFPDNSYINQYIGVLKHYACPVAHWSFHDYADIGRPNSAFPDAIHFLATLRNWGEPTNDVWVTESGPNGYPPSTYNVCDYSDQYYMAHLWLNLLRSGLVQHLFWYDAPSTSIFSGIYNPPGEDCTASVDGPNVAYRVLDTDY